MKRRAFLAGVGAAGWTLGARLARASDNHPRALERLRQLQIRIAAHAGPRDGELGAEPGAEAVLERAPTVRRAVSAGSLAIRAAPVPHRDDAVDLFVTLRPRASAVDASIGLSLRFGAWSEDDYLALPGACYAGNRFESRFGGYPPLLTEPADIGPHVPPIVSDIPRLNLHPGPSRLDVAAADLATPAAAIFLRSARTGLILLFDPTTGLGQAGFTAVESDDRRAATMQVRAPFSPPGSRVSNGAPSPDRSGGAKPARSSGPGKGPGGEVTLRARAYVFDCPELARLFERLFAVRKDLSGPTVRAPVLPFSAAFAAHEARVNRRWVESPGFLAAGACASAYSTWQTGWCGGFATTLPLLAAGDAASRVRALRTIGFVLDGGQVPSGFFHGVSDGTTWYDDGFTAPLPAATRPWPPRAAPSANARRWHLVRRSADTLDFLVKQLALLERRRTAAAAGPPSSRSEAPLEIDPGWSKAARLCADALARLWERNKQLGQFVDVDSGEIVVGGSTSAGLAPAGLARAAALFKQPRYLRVAQAAAAHYHDRYVRAGLTCGGPGDALQCPDSESAAALLESFVTLYEATGDRVWVDRARDAAHLLASWVISYDAPAAGRACAPPGAPRATGAILTDAQSRTGAPGYVLLSGDALFRLYRATGELAWLELLRDTAFNLAQYLPRNKPAAAGARPGEDCPRAATADWLSVSSGVIPPEGVFDAIGLLTYTEIPGVYAQTDAGLVFAFDHVEARVKERMPGRLVVALRNPTASEAKVRLFSETTADAAAPLGPDAVLDAPTAVVPPHSVIEVAMPPIVTPAGER